MFVEIQHFCNIKFGHRSLNILQIHQARALVCNCLVLWQSDFVYLFLLKITSQDPQKAFQGCVVAIRFSLLVLPFLESMTPQDSQNS